MHSFEPYFFYHWWMDGWWWMESFFIFFSSYLYRIKNDIFLPIHSCWCVWKYRAVINVRWYFKFHKIPVGTVSWHMIYVVFYLCLKGGFTKYTRVFLQKHFQLFHYSSLWVTYEIRSSLVFEVRCNLRICWLIFVWKLINPHLRLEERRQEYYSVFGQFSSLSSFGGVFLF